MFTLLLLLLSSTDSFLFTVVSALCNNTREASTSVWQAEVGAAPLHMWFEVENLYSEDLNNLQQLSNKSSLWV